MISRCPGTESSQTFPWSEVDSNLPFRARAATVVGLVVPDRSSLGSPLERTGFDPRSPIRPGSFQRRFRFPDRDGALDGHRPAAAIGLPSAVSDGHHPSPWAPNHQKAAGVLDPPQAW